MKEADITPELLTEVKGNLYISWVEDDDQVKKIILRSARYLQTKVSQALTFQPENDEYALLLERCRYDWNNALDEFETNYASELLAFIQACALKDWREQNGESTN